ncbi:hypothetical protein [Calycomorphotria hydatis]|uniref:Uncharacterized protein n=1 Tax=Calycomorphotria hydatis TaxID=2528027 RepID=A0A517TB33_9PLAN|nr:hypothetical protein [Calycomorphotria hydatis]QDT65576.1 hypothetical protein V22_28310 [Calycomorphotria hydatis]
MSEREVRNIYFALITLGVILTAVATYGIYFSPCIGFGVIIFLAIPYMWTAAVVRERVLRQVEETREQILEILIRGTLLYLRCAVISYFLLFILFCLFYAVGFSLAHYGAPQPVGAFLYEIYVLQVLSFLTSLLIVGYAAYRSYWKIIRVRWKLETRRMIPPFCVSDLFQRRLRKIYPYVR